MELVITESARKARRIAATLGDGYLVRVCTSPRDDAEALARLIKSARQADRITLATDPDWEGEALAQAIVEALPAREQKKTRRVAFGQLTQAAIREATRQPRVIDDDLVDAQRARRAMNRVAGARVAWLLKRWGLNGNPAPEMTLTQVAALRLVVEREWERRDAAPHRSWAVVAELDYEGNLFRAKVGDTRDLATPLDASRVVEQLWLPGTVWLVEEVAGRMEREAPPPPFTTSTLLGEAWRCLRFTPGRAGNAARALYEAGVVTHIHANSTHIDSSTQKLTRLVIGDLYGDEVLPERSPVYETAAGLQRTEAIRPTDPTLTPADGGETLRRRGLDGDALRLYGLIWRRFVASQMRPAAYTVVEAVIRPHWWGSVESWEEPELHAHPYAFHARWRWALLEGYRRVHERTADITSTPPELETLAEGVVLDLHRLDARKTEEVVPGRHTPARLIAALEEAGVGRPPDYAAAVEALVEREYVTCNGDGLAPTRAGEDVCYACLSQFPRLCDLAVMAEMETLLDRVAAGEATSREALEAFYQAEPALSTTPGMLRAPRLEKEAV